MQNLTGSLPDWLKRLITPPVFEDERSNTTAGLLSAVLLIFLFMAVLVPAIFLVIELATGVAVTSLVIRLTVTGFFFGLVILGSLWLLRRGYLNAVSIILLVALTIVGMSFSFDNGLGSFDIALYLLNLVLAGLLLGVPGVVYFGIIEALALFAIFLIEVNTDWISPIESATGFADLMSVLLYLGITAVLLQVGIRNQNDAFKRAERSQHILEEERRSLEARVGERTRQLRNSAEVAEAVSQILDQAELVQQVTTLISDRFGYYYAAIFLLDDNKEWAILRAATGEAGKKLLAQGHQLRVGGQSMVGTAISTGEARIALDVGEEAIRFDNPALPHTRSEIALPLAARGQVLGALDVQSTQGAAFTPEDLTILQTMANQVAIAIENARLLRTAQSSFEEVQRLNQVYLQDAWTDTAKALTSRAYQLVAGERVQAQDTEMPALEAAVRDQRPTVVQIGQTHSVTAPIVLRGQVIGALNLKAEGRKWTEEELAIIEAVTTQTALAMENARLIEATQVALNQSQRLAEREHTIGEIGDKIRGVPDVETILSTTLAELGRVLGAKQGTVRLNLNPALIPDGDGAQSNTPPNGGSLPPKTHTETEHD